MADGRGVTRRGLMGAGLAALMPGAAMCGEASLPGWTPGAAPRPVGPYVLADGRIRIVGTSIMRELVERLNARFAEAHPGFAFDLRMEPGLMAVGPIAYGTTPFAPMPRLFTSVELAAFRTIAGRDPFVLRAAHGSVVARDRTAALAIYVHRSNPLAHLDMDQVARIFGTGLRGGDLRTWGQLGLDGGWSARPIHPVGTPEDTGFGSFMVREVLGGMPLSPAMTVRATSAEVLKIVGDDAAAIAYSAINFGTASTRQVPLGTNTGGPFLLGTEAEVEAEAYPLDRYVYFYVLRRRDGSIEPWIADYLRLLLSRDGQEFVAAEHDGFLPLSPRRAWSERRLLDAASGLREAKPA